MWQLVILIIQILPNDISAFFYNSEQIPTVISLAVECTNDGKILCAGAFMVQLLPNADEIL